MNFIVVCRHIISYNGVYRIVSYHIGSYRTSHSIPSPTVACTVACTVDRDRPMLRGQLRVRVRVRVRVSFGVSAAYVAAESATTVV